LRHIRGFGEKRLADVGARLIECINSHR